MEERIKDLLNTLYEGEGLADLALRRSGAEREHILSLVADKCKYAYELSEALAKADKQTPDIEANTEVAHQPSFDKPEEEYVEEKEVEVFTQEVLPLIERPSLQTDISDASIFGEIESETSELATDPTIEELPEVPNNTVKPTLTRSLPEVPHKPLIKVMSVGDKFRVRMHVFNSDSELMNKAFSEIEQMETLEQARRYCFSELQFDPENNDVQAFIAILEKYFAL